MAERKRYTHVGVLVETQKKISILASVTGENIYDLVALWTDQAWEKAKEEGVVTDAMVQSPSPIQKKSAHARAVILAV